MASGRVYLVGAGPGDPGLITLKAIECLKKADVIVYDRLLDDVLLSVARPEAEKIYVGKASSRHTMPQAGINKLLVNKAREGKTVVRLKGGDPFVFGRGGEEAEELVKNGIDFEVVPGVTSAVAVPAYAGIPVTHRSLASSFAVITGHETPDKAGSRIDWAKVAAGADTLVFLMGLQNLPGIVEHLIKNGRSEDTPAAVIKDGTRPQQVTVTGTLKDIAGRVSESGLKSPAVIVVGEVVSMRETIRWFDNRPLSGKRILVTRARSQASSLSELLAARGAVPVELPAIIIETIPDNEELETAIRGLSNYDWVVFTSVNGVDAFFRSAAKLNLDSRALSGLKVAAIGPATAAALAGKGITPDCQPSIYTSRGLVAELARQNIAGQRFLLPRADIADKELVEGLTGSGAAVREITVYRTLPDREAIDSAREMLLSGRLDMITFTSSSTVVNLVSALGADAVRLTGVRLACIGPKTADTAVKAGLKPDVIAAVQTIPGLVAAIEEYFRKAE